MNKRLYCRQCCGECMALFEEGEEIYLWQDRYVCGECFDALYDGLSRFEKALRAGCEVVNYPIDLA